MKTNKEVIESFLKHVICNSTNLSSTQDKLFSYNTCIAERVRDILYVNITKYSTTTNQHTNMLLKTIKEHNYPIFIIYLSNIPINSNQLESYDHL